MMKNVFNHMREDISFKIIFFCLTLTINIYA